MFERKSLRSKVEMSISRPYWVRSTTPSSSLSVFSSMSVAVSYMAGISGAVVFSSFCFDDVVGTRPWCSGGTCSARRSGVSDVFVRPVEYSTAELGDSCRASDVVDGRAGLALLAGRETLKFSSNPSYDD